MNFAKNIATHVVVVMILWLASGYVAKLLYTFNVLSRIKLNWRQFGLITAVLVMADSAWVGYCARHDHGRYHPSQWGFIAYANPARIGLIDRFWASLFHEQPDLLAASHLLDERTEPKLDNLAQIVPVRTPSSAGKDYNVIIIMVESLSARLVAQTEMPLLEEAGEPVSAAPEPLQLRKLFAVRDPGTVVRLAARLLQRSPRPSEVCLPRSLCRTRLPHQTHNVPLG